MLFSLHPQIAGKFYKFIACQIISRLDKKSKKKQQDTIDKEKESVRPTPSESLKAALRNSSPRKVHLNTTEEKK